MYFETTRGSLRQCADFIAHGPGYQVYLSSTASTTVLYRMQGASSSAAKDSMGILRWQLLGANPRPTVRSMEEQTFKVNYLHGSDPSKWQTGIAAFAKVSYDEIYPGVNLVYYGNQARRLESDFVVARGADPTVIEFTIAGADDVAIDENGDLVIKFRQAIVNSMHLLLTRSLKGCAFPLPPAICLKAQTVWPLKLPITTPTVR